MSVARDAPSSLRRNLLGASGLICLLIGIYLSVWPLDGSSAEFAQGMCIKSGLVLMAAWLAFPQLDRLPGWMLLTVVALLLVLATRPRIMFVMVRMGIFLLPIFFLIWLLRPKAARRAPR
jgi:hypothetical protein